MTLQEALIAKGCQRQEVPGIMEGMVERVLNGEDPDEVLLDQGLEPDYVMELLEYGMEWQQ